MVRLEKWQKRCIESVISDEERGDYGVNARNKGIADGSYMISQENLMVTIRMLDRTETAAPKR